MQDSSSKEGGSYLQDPTRPCMACNPLGMTSKRDQKEAAGRWLRQAREKRGFTTASALARRMGVSESMVSRIETGLSAATDERAEQIAEALGMNIVDVRRNLGLWVPPDAGGFAVYTTEEASARAKILQAKALIRAALSDDAAEVPDVDEFRLEERVARIRRQLDRQGDITSAAEIDLWLQVYEEDAG